MEALILDLTLILVVAGAGTGKTATIVKRIENILNRGYANAWQVLAITFTNKAAGELAFLSDFSDKKSFLLYLAGIYWGKAKAEKVVTAWESFENDNR